MSAASSHPPRIVQARQAWTRDEMLTTMIAAAAISASQASALGGAEYAYSASPDGSHCQGPPTAPGTKVSLMISAMNVTTPAWLPGMPGRTEDVWSARTSMARYPATMTNCSAQARQ